MLLIGDFELAMHDIMSAGHVGVVKEVGDGDHARGLEGPAEAAAHDALCRPVEVYFVGFVVCAKEVWKLVNDLIDLEPEIVEVVANGAELLEDERIFDELEIVLGPIDEEVFGLDGLNVRVVEGVGALFFLAQEIQY